MVKIRTIILLVLLSIVTIALFVTSLVLPVVSANAKDDIGYLEDYPSNTNFTIRVTSDGAGGYRNFIKFGKYRKYQGAGSYAEEQELITDGIYWRSNFDGSSNYHANVWANDSYILSPSTGYPPSGVTTFYWYDINGTLQSGVLTEIYFPSANNLLNTVNDFDLFADNVNTVMVWDAYGIIKQKNVNFDAVYNSSDDSLNTYQDSRAWSDRNNTPHFEIRITFTFGRSFTVNIAGAPSWGEFVARIDPDTPLVNQTRLYDAFNSAVNYEGLSIGELVIESATGSTSFYPSDSISKDLLDSAVAVSVNPLIVSQSDFIADYYTKNYSSLVDDSYNRGHSAGVIAGTNQANNTVTTSSASYSAGYTAGVASAGDYSFTGLLGAVFDVPVKAFSQFFNFELLGVNLTALLSSLFVAAVIITVVRLCLGG